MKRIQAALSVRAAILIAMFDGATLTGWQANEHPESWKAVAGSIVGDGPASHLFWMARECEDCEFHAEVKLNHSGNSGMYVRAAMGPGFPKGCAAQVENTSPDPEKTGSDPNNRYAKGYVALQQHNPGGFVQFRNLLMRPIGAGE